MRRQPKAPKHGTTSHINCDTNRYAVHGDKRSQCGRSAYADNLSHSTATALVQSHSDMFDFGYTGKSVEFHRFLHVFASLPTNCRDDHKSEISTPSNSNQIEVFYAKIVNTE